MGLTLRGGCELAIIVAFAAPGCGPAGPTTGAATVKAGRWGGIHIAMTVAAHRTDLEFDCATASIDGSLDTDSGGVFTAAGTFRPDRPGPATPEARPSRPMQLSGTVNGTSMQANVRLTDENEDAGTFMLTLGARPQLFKCR